MLASSALSFPVSLALPLDLISMLLALISPASIDWLANILIVIAFFSLLLIMISLEQSTITSPADMKPSSQNSSSNVALICDATVAPSPIEYKPDSTTPFVALLLFGSSNPNFAMTDLYPLIPFSFSSWRYFLAFSGIANSFSFKMFIFVYLSLSLVMMKTSLWTLKDSIPFCKTSPTNKLTILYISAIRRSIDVPVEPVINCLSNSKRPSLLLLLLRLS